MSSGNPTYQSVDGVLPARDGKTSHTYPNGKDDATYTIPDGGMTIGDGAFWGCVYLTSVTIPDSVTKIGVMAFGNCKGLKSIEIPGGVTNIESSTFMYCGNLTSATIPSSVTNIQGGAFDKCEVLIIRTPAKSFAEKYAQKNDIDYVNSD